MLPPTKLPKSIEDISSEEAHALIRDVKARLKQDVIVLGHHYQRDDVISHADFTGDSLKLARFAQENSQHKYIIFCGVHFMAESADILTGGKCEVSLPDMGAGCDMADMAESKDIELAWEDAVEHTDGRIIPITYINSSAALKAIVGKNGGAICTSSNAKKVVSWALSQGKHVFFFPDQHLGRNIAKGLGFDPQADMLLWNPKEFLGGNTAKVIQDKKIWLWQGHCPVHALFTVHQIKKIRVASPETTILVHPECAMDVVDASDLNGSTDFIIKTIAAAPSGSSWAVGTEKNLVDRLAKMHPDKKIQSLNQFSCLCGTMNRISLHHLAWVMKEINDGKPLPNRIQVPTSIAKDAVLALDRMLSLS